MPAAILLYLPTARDLLAMPSRPDGEDWAILDVRGGPAGLRMFLPTGPLANLEGAYWTDWIAALHGPPLARTDASPSQHEVLLDIIYAFNIFTDGHTDVDPDRYTVFIAKIVEIATSDPPFVPADIGLQEITALARKLIPQSVWNVYMLPPPPDDPAELFGFPSRHEWVRAFINTWREARARLFHSPAHAIISAERALPFAPPPPPSTSRMHSAHPTHSSPSSAHTPRTTAESDCDSIPPPLESASESEGESPASATRGGTARAARSPSRDVIDSGYASDDSMPSLRTVDDSSDSDFESEWNQWVGRARELPSHLDFAL